ncbi:MAG: type II secretion system protein GspL [Candidatus Binataceae bacterium]
MGQRILALELSGNNVRAAVAERTWNALQLVGVHEQERTSDEADLTGAIARVLGACGKPDVVVSTLPGEFVAKRLLELPFGDNRRLRQVVPFALEEHLPFAVDDAVVAFTRVGRTASATLVMAAIARKDDLRRHLDLLARAGLDPKVVTLGTLALAGLLARSQNGAHEAHLVLDIDHASTSMVLIDADGTPRALRTVSVGLNSNNGNPLPQPAALAIVGAARQIMLAHAGAHQQTDLVLTGPIAAAATVRRAFADALEMQLRSVDEFDYSALIHGIKSEPLRYAACVAMLLAETPSRPLELLNFRQSEFAFQGHTGTLGPLRIPAILGGVLIALIILHFALGMSVSARKLQLLNNQIEAAAAPALGNQNPAQTAALLHGELGKMDRRLHMMGGNLGHGSPLDVLLALSRAIPPGLPVELSDIQINDSGVKMEGTADSFASVDILKKALERSPAFGQINLDHAAAGADATKVDFHFSATLKDSAGEMD